MVARAKFNLAQYSDQSLLYQPHPLLRQHLYQSCFLEYFFAEKGSERFQQPDLYCVYSADRSSVTVVLDKL